MNGGDWFADVGGGGKISCHSHLKYIFNSANINPTLVLIIALFRPYGKRIEMCVGLCAVAGPTLHVVAGTRGHSTCLPATTFHRLAGF